MPLLFFSVNGFGGIMGMIDKLQETIAPALADARMELVDMQITAEHGQRHVRIFIDKEEGGIKLDDCAQMSRSLGTLLDEKMPELENYVIEVSSPGIDRVLKVEKDFKRFIGKRAQITVFAPINGQRNFIGTLLKCENGMVEIDDIAGKIVGIEISKMARARLDPEI
jgi:ribosome maturation factor RimP